MEERQRSSQEIIGEPQLRKDVEYAITYEAEGQTVTLPPNYSVYRQVVRSYPEQPPLELTLTPDERSVTKADPR